MNAIARLRPVCRRASLRAASIASAPLLVKKTRFGPGPGASAASRSASRTWGA